MRKEKAIYHTMNLFSLDITSKCLVAEGWCPVADLSTIQQSLLRSSVHLYGHLRMLSVAAAVPALMPAAASFARPRCPRRTSSCPRSCTAWRRTRCHRRSIAPTSSLLASRFERGRISVVGQGPD